MLSSSFIEIEVFLGTLNHCFVGLVKVLLSYHISILAHCFHACFLANTGNVCCTDLVRTTHIQLQINVFREVHLGSYGLEDQSLLTAIRQWELDLTIQSARTEKGRIQSVVSISRHYHFHVDVLFEPVHLIQQFN